MQTSNINKLLQKIKKTNKIELNESIIEIFDRFRRDIPKSKIYRKRLVHELLLIQQFKFEQVFIQVCSILDLVKKKYPTMPYIIRGSAGSCLVCYLLEITNIDPIKNNIALSRFMHENRKSIPDIDIDFPQHIRKYIYQEIYNHWNGRVARISNHIHYKERSAIREAIRMNGHRKFVGKDKTVEDIFDDPEVVIQVKKNARNLIGKFKCYSLHCGGIVIFPDKVDKDLILKEIEPINIEIDEDQSDDDWDIGDYLKKSIEENKKAYQIKLDKEQTEKNGFIKIDILSNRGLSQLMYLSDKPITEYDYKDKKTWDMLGNGDNIGLTHAESRAIYKIFKIMKPRRLEHLAIALALIRPAASKNYQKSAFLREYQTDFKDCDDHFIIFDDDATAYIKSLLNCTDSEADNHRRAFSKNKQEKKQIFYIELAKKNLPYDEQVKITTKLEQLQFYSFCKSHAFSYAQLIYALAYHKANYPKKFWKATVKYCNSSYRKWVHLRESIVKLKSYSIDDDPIETFKKSDCWYTKKFLPGMYYEEYEKEIKPKNKLTKFSVVNGTKLTYAKFKGIVACARVFIKDKDEFGKQGYVTFCTIGYDNCKYIDLLLYGKRKISALCCLSGYGKLKKDGPCSWIEVSKNDYGFNN